MKPTLTATFDRVDEHGNIFLDLTDASGHDIGGVCVCVDPINGGYELSGDGPDCWADQRLLGWVRDASHHIIDDHYEAVLSAIPDHICTGDTP